MLIHAIDLRNLLSFGPESELLKMKPLNVLIGPNGSGKSNLIEAISLLQAAPKDLLDPIHKGGGVGEWIWKGEHEYVAPLAKIATVVQGPNEKDVFFHALFFREKGQRLEVVDEAIASISSSKEEEDQYLYFDKLDTLSEPERGPKFQFDRSKELKLNREELDPQQSVLSQLKGTRHYRVLTHIGNQFGKIRIYRDWSFGRNTPTRHHQPADLPIDFLSEDFSNLGLVLNQMKQTPKVKAKLLEALREIYEGVTDFEVSIVNNYVQVTMHEGDITIPAPRLSDGTLRYLCLLAILCHPNPPPLICIEEPELGLHPDMLLTLGKLLIEASERCQLIVTTHSGMLVDMMTDTPENVVVCGKHEGKTSMRRLSKEKLDVWLKDYGLGQLWTEGEIGGNRW